MTDMVPYTAQPAWVELLAPAVELARQVSGTEFVPAGLRNRNGAIVACILYGAELGLGPMQSLAQVAVIDGRPAPSAQLARGLALGAGHEVWIEDATSTKATVAGQRRGSDHVQRVTWTMDDARRARLDGKSNWRAYPRQMLVARATAELVRNLAPDVLGGITLVAEELEDLPDEEARAPQPVSTKRRRRSLAAVPTPEEPEEALDAPLPPAPPPPPPESPEPPEEPEEPVEPLTAAGAPTPAQMRLMHGLFNDVGLTNRERRLKLTEEIVGRQLASSKDLTAVEMSLVLDDLARRAAEGWVAL